jgi:hypothetical protein
MIPDGFKETEIGSIRADSNAEAVLGKNLHPSARNQLRRAFGDTCQP